IKYLLREREQGKEKFEIADFFKPDLEEQIIANFNNEISISEYEELVYSIFGAGGGKITEGRVKKEVQKYIRQYRMRSKKQILQKLMLTFKPLPSEMELLRDLVTMSYNKFMLDPLRIKINALVREGTTNLRSVLSVLRREKYDIDRDIIEDILQKILADQQKSKSRMSLGGRKDIGLKLELSPVKKRIREQMRKTLLQKARLKKQQFIKMECPKYRFELKKEKFEGDTKTVNYAGEVNNAELIIQSTISSEHKRVKEIHVICRKKGDPKGASINIKQFETIKDNSKAQSLMQQWLKNIIPVIGFGNIQEVLWFLMSILNEKFGLAREIDRYLRNNFTDHLIEFDRTITKFVIEKALEKV
ncbi:hypothetical protein ACFL6L_04205, partial [candidate division KSB1 bacterium]